MKTAQSFKGCAIRYEMSRPRFVCIFSVSNNIAPVRALYSHHDFPTYTIIPPYTFIKLPKKSLATCFSFYFVDATIVAWTACFLIHATHKNPLDFFMILLMFMVQRCIWRGFMLYWCNAPWIIDFFITLTLKKIRF